MPRRWRTRQVRLLQLAVRVYPSGDTPERIARLDKELTCGVHLCDPLPYTGWWSCALFRDRQHQDNSLWWRET